MFQTSVFTQQNQFFPLKHLAGQQSYLRLRRNFLNFIFHTLLGCDHIYYILQHLMARRFVSKQGPASPRSETLEEEDVFDYAGLDDYSDESGPVPREAYVALRKGIWFKFKFT